MKKITKERILQISNDVSEDMCTASKKELIETIRFWQNEHTRWVNAFNEVEGSMSVLAIKIRITKQELNS